MTVMNGEIHASASLPPEIDPLVTHSIEGWVGPRTGFDAVE
jgi:hypothetical protein